MAKFKIDVDIDCLDEDGSLDEQLMDSIKEAIINKVQTSVLRKIEETAADVARKQNWNMD